MKGTLIKDFDKMFFFPQDVQKQQGGNVIRYAEPCVEHFRSGDEVEVLKIIEDNELDGGKGYLIYNPLNHASTVVAEHILRLKD